MESAGRRVRGPRNRGKDTVGSRVYERQRAVNVDNGAMDECDGKLERLSEMLEALGAGTDAMTVGEMDGFVTGLALFPERVGHREWLPHVLGSEP